MGLQTMYSFVQLHAAKTMKKLECFYLLKKTSEVWISLGTDLLGIQNQKMAVKIQVRDIALVKVIINNSSVVF